VSNQGRSPGPNVSPSRIQTRIQISDPVSLHDSNVAKTANSISCGFLDVLYKKRRFTTCTANRIKFMFYFTSQTTEMSNVTYTDVL